MKTEKEFFEKFPTKNKWRISRQNKKWKNNGKKK